jgi:hypothetical protein
MDESELAERLRKIQSLFAGATTEGERTAAGAAQERVAARLEAFRQEAAEEFQFSLGNPWSRRLLIALLRRHQIRPYRHHRQRHTTIMARMSKRFCDEVLWPEFSRLDETLKGYLEEVATRVISQVVHANQADADVVAGTALTGSATRSA